jgi:hypothetical protein
MAFDKAMEDEKDSEEELDEEEEEKVRFYHNERAIYSIYQPSY